MIEVRKKKMFNPSGKKKEYYLASLGEWLTVNEMAELNGCTVMAESIKGRIKNATDNPEFRTLEGCIFTPKKIGNGMNIKEAKKYRENRQIESEFNLWINLHKLWPVLKDTTCKPLIMQSRAIR